MKAAKFDYARPETLEEAVTLLSREGAKVMAGSQSLGPMMNMRLVETDLLVDVTGIPEMVRIEETRDGVTLGGCITHSAIEDGRVPDATRGVLPGIAANIAYRAVRNRGTIGGSLAHADPAADWVVVLAALEGELTTFGPNGRRRIAIAELVTGAFETVLAADEILEAVHIPKLSNAARWGFCKMCRKTGAFAQAMCAVFVEPSRGVSRLTIGVTDSAPIVISEASKVISEPGSVAQLLRDAGLADDWYRFQLHVAAVRRAVAQASQA